MCRRGRAEAGWNVAGPGCPFLPGRPAPGAVLWEVMAECGKVD